MKIITSTFKIVFILVLASILVSCSEGPKKLGIEKIIAVKPHSESRIYVIYKDANGLYYYFSTYHAKKITDGTVTIDPHDYLPRYGGKKPYGPLPNCEKEYEEYKVQRRASSP